MSLGQCPASLRPRPLSLQLATAAAAWKRRTATAPHRHGRKWPEPIPYPTPLPPIPSPDSSPDAGPRRHLDPGRRFKASDPDGQLPTSRAFLSGGLAGAVAAFLTTPLDVLKTRRQVESGGAGGGSTAGMLVRIAQAEGPLALFAGVAPRLAKVAPSCAIMIASYEMGKRYFSSLPSRERGLG